MSNHTPTNGLSLADLEKGNLEHLSSTIWNFYSDSFDPPSPREIYWMWFCKLPRGIRFGILWNEFCGDLLNGGICQFFDNHFPMQIYATLEMFQEAELRESAELLKRAMKIFSEEYDFPPEPDDQRFNRAFLRAYDNERLDALDHLYDGKASERDYIQVNKFLRLHLDECVYPPEK